jgi:hypothetical protein
MAHSFTVKAFFHHRHVDYRFCLKKEEETLTTAAPMGKDFDLELIDSVPQTLLDGCGEYLTHDSIKGIAVSYLFVSDLTKYGMIRMDYSKYRPRARQHQQP